jgi:hypothetical protein
MKSPSEELVEAIVPLLVQDQLLLADDLQRFKEKIARGLIKQEDWFLMAEKAMQKEAK